MNAWWDKAFAEAPYESSAPGPDRLLTLVAYDIAEPKRLARVARICEDHGVRIQYSLFECRLTEADFAGFWGKLLKQINGQEDRLVAYKIDARCARETLTAGTMVRSDKVLCYLV